MLLIASGAVLLAGMALLTFFGGTTTQVPAGIRNASPGGGIGGPIRDVGAFSLTNHLGTSFTRNDLLGRPWAVNLIFTRCPGPCTQLSGVMRTVQSKLPKASVAGILSLTSDPEHDGPEVLSAYAAKFGAETGRWHFVTGAKSEIRRLAVEDLMLVVQEKSPELRESPEDLFLHSTMIILVDAQSRIRRVVEGLEPGAAEAVLSALADLERESKR